mmetsp:Transcript_15606/g.38501  ORF Transcript_15606/g.38501 Transcript_15606/m.38501 type:complete len:283 (-) Transcript_15606:2077-2925(-)
MTMDSRPIALSPVRAALKSFDASLLATADPAIRWLNAIVRKAGILLPPPSSTASIGRFRFWSSIVVRCTSSDSFRKWLHHAMTMSELVYGSPSPPPSAIPALRISGCDSSMLCRIIRNFSRQYAKSMAAAISLLLRTGGPPSSTERWGTRTDASSSAPPACFFSSSWPSLPLPSASCGSGRSRSSTSMEPSSTPTALHDCRTRVRFSSMARRERGAPCASFALTFRALSSIVFGIAMLTSAAGRIPSWTRLTNSSGFPGVIGTVPVFSISGVVPRRTLTYIA